MSAPVRIPTQVGLILLGQSRQGDGDARQVDALVGGHSTGHDDLGVHVVALDLGDLKTGLAVIDQDRVARVAIARQACEGGGGDVLVALDVISGDDEFLAELQLNLVFAIGVLLEPTAANLRYAANQRARQRCDQWLRWPCARCCRP